MGIPLSTVGRRKPRRALMRALNYRT
jgi:hypothetical protein